MITGILSIKSGKATISPSANAKIKSIPASIIKSMLSIKVSTISITELIITGMSSGKHIAIPSTRETTT